MANLLTIEAKKKKSRARQLRQLTVIFGLLGGLFLIAFIFNLALWLNFNIQKGSINLNSVLRDRSTLGVEESRQAKDKITQLAKWWPESDWSIAIVKIKEYQPQTIKIQQIAGVYSEKNKAMNMMLNGETTSRQDLVKFTEELKQDNFFSSVELPIESLLVGSNGQFSLSLGLKNND